MGASIEEFIVLNYFHIYLALHLRGIYRSLVILRHS